MSADGSPIPRPSADPSSAHAQYSLRDRATFALLGSLLTQSARLIVRFFVTPVVAGGLGPHMYGLWLIISQSVGYLSLTDFSPMATLKLLLGVRQHSNDVDEKRRLVGGSVLTWIVSLPVFGLVAALLIYYISDIVDVTPEELTTVKIAMSIVCASVMFDRIVALPANVLRGENLEFKAIGVQAASVVLTGFFLSLAVWLGWGLIGVAAASVAGSLFMGAVRLQVVLRNVSWFGLLWPRRDEFFRFLRASGWVFGASLGYMLLVSSDALIVNSLLGSSQTAIYALTAEPLRLLARPLGELVGAASPGFLGLGGKADWKRSNEGSIQIALLILFLCTVVGVCVVLLNRSFVSLWVGEAFYGGDPLTLTLVCGVIIFTLSYNDTTVLNSALRLRERVIALGMSGAIGVLSALSLGSVFGLVGVAAGQGVGFLCQKLLFVWFIEKVTGLSALDYWSRLGRALIVCFSLIIFASSVVGPINATSWIGLIGRGGAVALLVATAMFFLGFGPRERAILRATIAQVTRAVRRSF